VGDKSRKNAAFTLIELLVVIAIIAILASILMVAVRRGIQTAQKARAASHMRQIILAYESYIQGWGGDLGTINLGPEATAHDWIAELAKRGYLNDPRLVAFDFDPLVSRYTAAGLFGHFFGVLAPQIWNPSSASLNNDFKNMPLSLCFVANLNTRKTTAHTPLLWTRGLNGEGTWNSREGSTGDGSDGGIWGDSGGLIGFIGGRVEWFPSLTGEHELPTYDGSGTIFNIWQAVNDDAWVVDWKGPLTTLGGGTELPTIDYEETLKLWEGFSGDVVNDAKYKIKEWFSSYRSWRYAVPNFAYALVQTANDDGITSIPTYAHAMNDVMNLLQEVNNGIANDGTRINDPIKILPAGFNTSLLSANAAQLNSLRDELDSTIQELTETEQADYDVYIAFYKDVPALIKSNPSNAASITEAYLNEYLMDHKAPSKGSVLAMAMMMVDLASYWLNQPSSE
jgi:prepilin-type N-terminal cleavage/methylation domain-containing protein